MKLSNWTIFAIVVLVIAPAAALSQHPAALISARVCAAQPIATF